MHDRLVPSSVQSVSSGKEESRSVGACDLDGGLSVFSRYQLPLPRCSGRAPGSPESHSVARFAIAGRRTMISTIASLPPSSKNFADFRAALASLSKSRSAAATAVVAAIADRPNLKKKPGTPGPVSNISLGHQTPLCRNIFDMRNQLSHGRIER